MCRTKRPIETCLNTRESALLRPLAMNDCDYICSTHQSWIAMQKYRRLPTTRNQTWLFIGSAVIYTLLALFGDYSFNGVSPATKKVFSQLGISLILVGSLAGGLGLVSSAFGRKNAADATRVIESMTAKNDLLRTGERENGLVRSVDIAANDAEIEEARKQLAMVEALPLVYERAGYIALTLIAIGSACCFVGAG